MTDTRRAAAGREHLSSLTKEILEFSHCVLMSAYLYSYATPLEPHI
jgi:hypothetical protein